MKNFNFSAFIVGILITCFAMRADVVVLNDSSQVLLRQLKAIYSDENKISRESHDKIISGLNSDYDEVRIEATKCIIFYRLADLWERNNPNMKRGTSNKLAFIVYGLFGTARDINLPLIELLPSFVINEAKMYRNEKYAFQIGGDVPLGLVLIDLIVRDTIRFCTLRNNYSQINLLRDFELSSEQTQYIHSIKKDF